MIETTLTGFRARNPMAAMAAYGLLRITPELLMRWDSDDYPVINMSLDDIIHVLPNAIDTEVSLIPVLPKKAEGWETLIDYKTFLAKHDEPGQRWIRSMVWVTNNGKIAKTPFLSSVRKPVTQLIQEAMKKVAKKMPDAIEEALVGPWKYQDEVNHLHLDPSSHRIHARSTDQPTQLKPEGVAIVLVLALMALPYYAPIGRQNRIAWYKNHFRWVTWSQWTTRMTARHFMGHPLLNSEQVPDLTHNGVTRVFSAKQVNVSGTSQNSYKGLVLAA
jgi:hypothetical protein